MRCEFETDLVALAEKLKYGFGDLNIHLSPGGGVKIICISCRYVHFAGNAANFNNLGSLFEVELQLAVVDIIASPCGKRRYTQKEKRGDKEARIGESIGRAVVGAIPGGDEGDNEAKEHEVFVDGIILPAVA